MIVFMKWLMALLAVVALAEAGLSVCASGHAYASGLAMAPAAQDAASTDHHHEGHHGHHDLHPETDSATVIVMHDHCPDCAEGWTCGECAMVNATRASGFDALGPLPSASPRAHYVDVAPRRVTGFDPPPPKA